MLLPDWAVLDAAIDFFANGVWRLSWWQVVIFTLVVTHITIASVTIKALLQLLLIIYTKS